MTRLCLCHWTILRTEGFNEKQKEMCCDASNEVRVWCCDADRRPGRILAPGQCAGIQGKVHSALSNILVRDRSSTPRVHGADRQPSTRNNTAPGQPKRSDPTPPHPADP